MSFYSFTKQGAIFSGGGQYYPSVIDTSGLAGWPWTVTCFVSTDHGVPYGYTYICGAVGDPTVLANWETYATALARGAFDAFPTKPSTSYIYTDPDTTDAETPSVNKIGNQYYLTYHDKWTATSQGTRLAQASDYPLNFSRYATASGKILDHQVAPLNKYPCVPANDHTGYFRWAPNVFPKVPYAYCGYGLFGGGAQPHSMMYGSNDAISWTPLTIRELEPYVPGFETNYELVWHEADPHSIRDVGGGEFVVLVAASTRASGDGQRVQEIYEITVDSAGRRITRAAVKVIPKGGVGALDENEAATPAVIEYNGQLLCIYHGVDANNANSLMLATGKFNPAAAKAAPIASKNFERYNWNAVGQSALPAWLQAEGTSPVFDTNGLRLRGGGGIRTAFDITMDTVGWAEVYIKQNGDVVTNVMPFVQIGDSGPGEVNNGVIGLSYSSINNTRIATRASAAPTASLDIGYGWYSNIGKRHHVGIRWDAVDQELIFLGGNRDQVRKMAATSVVTNVPMKARVSASAASTNSFEIEEIEVRVGTTGAGVAPTVSTATFSASAILMTFSADLVGDGTGISFTLNSAPLAGQKYRIAQNKLLFVPTSGGFADTDAVAYSITATDLRSESDLVPIANTSGAAVWAASLGIMFINSVAASGVTSSGATITLGLTR